MRTKADRDEDLALGRELERKDSQIDWYKSALVSLLTLAEAKPSPLTNEEVASVCKRALEKYQEKPHVAVSR